MALPTLEGLARLALAKALGYLPQELIGEARCLD